MSKNIKDSFDIMELTNSFLTGNTKDVVDIITFAEAPWGLNFELLPSQKFCLKAFYGMELDNKNQYIPVRDVINEKTLYTFSEAEFLNFLYQEGRCNTNEVTGKNFKELDLVFGRRGTKSTCVALISVYELYKLVKRGNPLDYYKFPAQEKICLLNAAPSDDQAKIIYDQNRKLVSICPYLQPRIVNETQESFGVMTDFDLERPGKKNQATILFLSGGCSSNALRGQNAILTVMDESAFFLLNAGRFSGQEVYDALTPSTSTFNNMKGSGDGKIICCSSPHVKHGMFYKRYQQSFNEKDTTLMFQMYSAMANPGIVSIDLKTARQRDRTKFNCESGGEFSDSISAWIDDENQFRECVKEDLRLKSKGFYGISYFMAIDLGFKNDGTAISVCHRDPETGKIILDYVSVWYSRSSDVWNSDNSIYKNCNKFANQELIKVGAVADEIFELNKLFPIKAGFFDQNNGYALMEKLHEMGLKQFQMQSVSESLNHEVYQVVKTLYQDNQVLLPDHPVYIPELLSLQAEKCGKNKISVKAPDISGAHDDLSDSICYAFYNCYKFYHENPSKITSANSNNKSILSSRGSTEASMSLFNMNKYKKHGTVPRNSKYAQLKNKHRR